MASFWASTGLVAATFNQVDQLAAGLMLPTAIWVTIAAKLNWVRFQVVFCSLFVGLPLVIGCYHCNVVVGIAIAIVNVLVIA